MATLAEIVGAPMLGVGGVLLGILVLFAQLGRGTKGGGLPRPDRVRLTQTHAVHVVEVAGRRLLIGTGPSGAPRLLSELPPIEVADRPGRDDGEDRDDGDDRDDRDDHDDHDGRGALARSQSPHQPRRVSWCALVLDRLGAARGR